MDTGKRTGGNEERDEDQEHEDSLGDDDCDGDQQGGQILR